MNPQDLSSYVDRGDLLEALRDLTGRSDVELEDGVEVERATRGVEGFLSLVLRVRVPYRCGDGTKHSAVVIAKCMPREGPQRDIVNSTRAFPREGTYFDKVFPLLRRASGGKVTLPMPMCYHTRYDGDDDTIYMEDLSARGFRTPAVAYRTKGLDIDHCRLAMEAYGRLHALTIAAERLLPEDKGTWANAFPVMTKDPLLISLGPGKPPTPFKGMMEQSINTLLEIAKGLDGLPKEAEASGKLRSALDDSLKMMLRLVRPETSSVKVLTHGDCWMNNSMFRYENVGEEIKPVEIKLIDFQIVRYIHPCLDIVSFMYLSVRKTFRLKHMNSLIGVYYDSLERNLSTLNYGVPPFTLEEFLNAFHGVFEGFGFVSESLFMPLMLLGEEFAPSNAEELTPEKYSEFVKTGNSSSVRSRYASDPNFRLVLDEIIRDLVNNIFPNGINSPISPLFSC